MDWLPDVINRLVHGTNVKSLESQNIPVRKGWYMPISMTRKLRFTEVTTNRIGIQFQLFNDNFKLFYMFKMHCV